MLHEMLTVFGPLFAFMLIPLWVPLMATVLGWISDRLFPREPSPVRAAVEAAVARTRDAPQARGNPASSAASGGSHREQLVSGQRSRPSPDANALAANSAIT